MIIKRDSFESFIRSYINGDDTAGDSICKALGPPIQTAISHVLSAQDADADDIAQDSMIAFLRYLRKTRIEPDNAEAFATTIARNRCFNLILWRRRRTATDVDEIAERLPHIGVSALDLIEEEQRKELVANTLRNLEERCRALLYAIYSEQTSIEELRLTLGLKTVQAVYYRRDVCIEKAAIFLNRHLFSCLSIQRGKSDQGDGR